MPCLADSFRTEGPSWNSPKLPRQLLGGTPRKLRLLGGGALGELLWRRLSRRIYGPLPGNLHSNSPALPPAPEFPQQSDFRNWGSCALWLAREIAVLGSEAATAHTLPSGHMVERLDLLGVGPKGPPKIQQVTAAREPRALQQEPGHVQVYQR